MKDRAFNYLSLLLSVASLGYAAWVHKSSQVFAARALRERETELVRRWTPELTASYRDMGLRFPTNPATLEELLDPWFRMISRIGEMDESSTNKTTAK